MCAVKRNLAILCAAMAAIALSLVSPAATVWAHETNACGDGQPTRWQNTSTSMGYPGSWTLSYRNGIIGAQTSFNSSDFDYITDSQSSALVQWGDLNSPNTNVAGSMTGPVNCSTNPNYFQAVYLYYNFPHFNATNHNTSHKQCVAIHEMGHGVGLAHNELTSINRTNEVTQCHNNSWNTLQSHDVSDINGKY